MTKTNLPHPAHAGPRWQQESPGRHVRDSEADAHEAAVEHYSTTPHKHEYVVPLFAGTAPEVCRFCGGWRERIEGRVV